MNQLIIQGIGLIALLFILLSFQKNKRATILLFMIGGLVLFVIHYSLLHALTGALMNLIESGIVFVSYQKEKKPWARKRVWLYISILMYIIAGILTSKSVIDYFPVFAQSVGAVAVWQKKTKSIRLLMLIPRPLWFIYNLVVHSYAGMLTEIILSISIIIGMYRFDFKRK